MTPKYAKGAAFWKFFFLSSGSFCNGNGVSLVFIFLRVDFCEVLKMRQIRETLRAVTIDMGESETLPS